MKHKPKEPLPLTMANTICLYYPDGSTEDFSDVTGLWYSAGPGCIRFVDRHGISYTTNVAFKLVERP